MAARMLSGVGVTRVAVSLLETELDRDLSTTTSCVGDNCFPVVPRMDSRLFDLLFFELCPLAVDTLLWELRVELLEEESEVDLLLLPLLKVTSVRELVDTVGEADRVEEFVTV